MMTTQHIVWKMPGTINNNDDDDDNVTHGRVWVLYVFHNNNNNTKVNERPKAVNAPTLSANKKIKKPKKKNKNNNRKFILIVYYKFAHINVVVVGSQIKIKKSRFV